VSQKELGVPQYIDEESVWEKAIALSFSSCFASSWRIGGRDRGRGRDMCGALLFWGALLVAEDRIENEGAAPEEWEGEDNRKGEWKEASEGRSKCVRLERGAGWGSYRKGLEG